MPRYLYILDWQAVITLQLFPHIYVVNYNVDKKS